MPASLLRPLALLALAAGGASALPAPRRPAALLQRRSSVRAPARLRLAAAPPAVMPGGRSAVKAAAAAASDTLGNLKQVVAGARVHLAAAAAARAVSIFAMYPVDTVKTRLQMGAAAATTGGVGGLYNGVLSSLAGQVPYGMLTFASYDVYKRSLLNRYPKLNKSALYAAAAVMGDLTGSLWLCPSETVKQQVQGGLYATAGQAARGLWKANGVRGLYQGYAGQISRDVPFRVAQLVSYELVKTAWAKARGSPVNAKTGEVELKAWESTCVGAIAGSASAAVTTPLDVLKTRLMTTTQYSGVWNALTTISREEGLKGLFGGLAPRVLYIGPSCAIFFVVYEETAKRVRVRLAAEGAR